MEESQNLSEILFKPKFDYPETSMISNSGVDFPTLSHHDKALGFSEKFYRPILKFDWVIGGGSALDIDEALAKICVSDAKRNREGIYDTVSEYGPGHWNFEFNTIAQRRVTLAHECEEKGDTLKASHHYRLAARYFAIAAYPYMKGDILAQNSDALCRSTYKKMYDVDPSNGILQEHFFNVDSKKVTGYLHLPDLKEVYPCVVIVCPYESSISAFYRFINDHLRPQKIAAFVIEMPGSGSCEKLNLMDHFSLVVESAVDYLAGLKYIDATDIALCGYGLSATCCIRAAILNPNKIKALGLAAPLVHSFFTDREILDSLPLCLRSSLCNRIGFDASHWDNILPQLKSFSLKEQGILSSSGGCKVPAMVCITEESVVSKSDVQMLKNNFAEIEVKYSESMGYSEFMKKSLHELTSFFSKKFKS